MRTLTTGEIALAKTVFGNRIDYEKVKIHHSSCPPFGGQGANVAITPNGEMYFGNTYHDDFSKASDGLQHLFIHAMSQVWQRETAVNIIGTGCVNWLVSYHYLLDGRLLSEYPMEQQAQIIADSFILQTHGYGSWMLLRRSHEVTLDGDISESAIRQSYQRTLRDFPW